MTDLENNLVKWALKLKVFEKKCVNIDTQSHTLKLQTCNTSAEEHFIFFQISFSMIHKVEYKNYLIEFYFLTGV